jgi:hypothetical protein
VAGHDLQTSLAADAATFPFACELSLAPLVDFWTKDLAAERSVRAEIGRMVEREAAQVPELLAPIDDVWLLTRHRELVDLLMSVVFPPVFWDQAYGAIMVPFQLRSVYGTPSFERLLMSEDGVLKGRIPFDARTVRAIRLTLAYALIVRRVYGIDLGVDPLLVITATDPETGLDRHFKMQFDYRFVEVVPRGPVPTLGEETKRRLRALATDPAALMELLPPAHFAFRGFTVFHAVEVTDAEVLSSIKRDLIDKESIISTAKFLGLQDKLRTLFRLPHLGFGLAAIDGDQVLLLNSTGRLEHACIFTDSAHHKIADFAGSVYEAAVTQGGPLLVDDLAVRSGRHPVEEELFRLGIRSMLVTPLYYQDELIGTLGLGSTGPGDFTGAHVPKLKDVAPLFSMAVKRSMEELEARIQAFIKEKATAIHPTVEWRFRQAVLKAIERSRAGDAGPLEMEEIVFDGVHPLYALSDIRGSSTQRALAIQADLLTQLGLARDVLRAAHRARPLHALDELAFRVDTYVRDIEMSLRTGDETTVIAFLRKEVEPLFDHLQGFGAEVRAAVEAYREALEPRLGTVYRQRKAFEDSVTLMNETISAYVDLEEQAAQAMFPHYFEKQKTDGVDYGIYVGASLIKDGRFDPLYLKNLRIWQLMVACGVAMRTERLKDRLAVPLEATHLILVQHAPLSIRFRFDEKRFDVDGAYNIRYEIVKKRIDKATVRGTGERLTQPGKIAIVYAQAGEAAEYRDYLAYLQHLGYLAPDVEELEVDDLQGVQGLKALRVAVELENPRLREPVAFADLERAG